MVAVPFVDKNLRIGDFAESLEPFVGIFFDDGTQFHFGLLLWQIVDSHVLIFNRVFSNSRLTI